MSDVREKYRAWDSNRIDEGTQEEVIDIEESEEAIRQVNYVEAKEIAWTEIEEDLSKMNEYNFQDLVAELLSAMGYYVRHVVPPGPDGGIDILAYKDPLGSSGSRIIVQVKHGQEKTNQNLIKQLIATLHKHDDIGLFVSFSGFTSKALMEVRHSTKHVDTMDLERLMNLWISNYPKISEKGKSLLPLVPVYLLAPSVK
ncbi:MAG: restriction endonuclease [Candidatus Hatepunaea meridiana]|nr:restriction endonuclease [Candidatus Hatepunaea meridiana]